MALMGWWAWILAGARMPGMFAEKQVRSKGRTNLTSGHVSQSWNSTGPAAGADKRLKVHLPDSLKWIKKFFKVSTVPFQAQARKRTKRRPEKESPAKRPRDFRATSPGVSFWILGFSSQWKNKSPEASSLSCSTNALNALGCAFREIFVLLLSKLSVFFGWTYFFWVSKTLFFGFERQTANRCFLFNNPSIIAQRNPHLSWEWSSTTFFQETLSNIQMFISLSNGYIIIIRAALAGRDGALV